MKAIKTGYKGIVFRSRTEAKWAVFFDKVGFIWEYEPEGFTLSDGRWYLPDFKVKTPQGKDIWYEVKPTQDKDDGKFSKLMEDLHREYGVKKSTGDIDSKTKPTPPRGELLVGSPYDFYHTFDVKMCPRCGLIHTCEHGYCFACDMETPTGGNNPTEIGVRGSVTPHKGYMEMRPHDESHFMSWVSGLFKNTIQFSKTGHLI